MRARDAVTPVALIVLATGAAGYAYVADRGTVDGADLAARARFAFPSLRPDDVTRIELVHGSEAIVLARTGDAGSNAQWSVMSPRPESADGAAVDTLVSAMGSATRLRSVDVRDAPGLDTPRARGVVRTGSTEHTFALGNDSMRPEGAAYFRVDDEKPFVIERALKELLLRGADTYRNRSLVSFGGSGATSFAIESGAKVPLVLERHGATFRIGGSGVRAARPKIEALWSALANGRIDRFLTNDAGSSASGETSLRVSIAPRDVARPRVELRLGGACPDDPEQVVVVRVVPDQAFGCTSRALSSALEDASAETWTDLAPLFAHADEIEELRLEPVNHPGPVIDVARKGSGWHERSPDDRELLGDAAGSTNALMQALAEARATELVGSAATEPFEPRARVTIARTESEDGEVLELGAASADGSYTLRRRDDGALLQVSHAVGRRFEPHAAVLRDRSVWPSSFNAAGVVELESTCGPVPVDLALEGGTWVFRSPSGPKADPASIADVLGSLSHLKADAWVDEQDDGSFGLGGAGNCHATLVVGAADAAPARWTLSFGDAAEGGAYARSSADSAILVAPASLQAALSRPPVDRSLFRWNPSDIVGLALVHEGKRHAVDLSDAGASDAIRGAVSELFAQEAIHLGPARKEEGFEHPSLELLETRKASPGGPQSVHITIGGHVQLDGAELYFARVSGVDATFVVPKDRVDVILRALSEERR